MLASRHREARVRDKPRPPCSNPCADADPSPAVPFRRVKIQILLHLLKLSLSGHCPPVPVRPVPSHARKRRRVQPSSDDDEDATPRSILEDRLEGLMDRLVLWQMALPDAETADADVDGTKALRDWTQTFCDDVVQPA